MAAGVVVVAVAVLKLFRNAQARKRIGVGPILDDIRRYYSKDKSY